MLVVVPEEPGDAFAWNRPWTGPGTAGSPPPVDPTGSAAPDAAPLGSTPAAGFSAPPVSSPSTATEPVPVPGWVPPGAPSGGYVAPDYHAQRAAARAARRADRAARRAEHGVGGGALVFGIILILIGGYFLVREYIPQIDIDVVWPLVIIVLGVVLLFGALRPRTGPDA